MIKNGKRIEELNTGHKPISLSVSDFVKESICKITFIGENKTGTGFFMNISDTLKCLITNYHVINPYAKLENIEIEIHNNKKMKLDSINRNIKYIEQPKDITVIEIKMNDEIYKDIKFLDYDRNYISGYDKYQKADVFSIQHPLGKEAAIASGTIVKVDNYEFDHNISTDSGSSGSPILLLNDNIKLIKVIGIHKNADREANINGGTFIAEIFKEINTNLIESNNDNYIIAELEISDDEAKKEVKIINSYEAFLLNHKSVDKSNNEYMNEKEIKQCEIKINDELIPFNYNNTFTKKGKYIIKYSFKKNLNNASYLFFECKNLKNIDFSNFNAENIKSMHYMFGECKALTNINFSNFNTKNVIDMGELFRGCDSLTEINLSSFDTKNVSNMSCMFYGCNKLENIILSNFNTQNVKNMNSMFFDCNSLKAINLSEFDTQNVINMGSMFYKCTSLENIDLNHFITKKVEKMDSMFFGCKSLIKINISKFETQNVDNMSNMFNQCSLLTNLDLSNFNAAKIKSIRNMFFGCESLMDLDLSNFIIQNSIDFTMVFKGCKKLNQENAKINDNILLNHLKFT